MLVDAAEKEHAPVTSGDDQNRYHSIKDAGE